MQFEYSKEIGLDSEITKKRFESEVAIVCGGGSGIGRATVERFINDGASVAIFDINPNFLPFDEKYAKKIKFYLTDCSKKQNCVDNVTNVLDEFGKINHLVYSVAYFGSETFNASEDDWSKSLMINVAGAGYMIGAVAPLMKENNRKTICLMTSISQVSAQPNRWTYGASKGALWTLVRHSALELAKEHGCRINSVSPSWIWTPEVAKADYASKEELQDSVGKHYHMLGRVGETNEIAAAITFLASRDASFIHGHDLHGESS